MQVSTLGQTVGAGCFHQAVDHCTGPGSFYRVTEQPVFASHSKGMGGVLGKVIENLTPGVKQVVLHVGLLFTGVLHSLFQISGQSLLFQFFRPTYASVRRSLGLLDVADIDSTNFRRFGSGRRTDHGGGVG